MYCELVLFLHLNLKASGSQISKDSENEEFDEMDDD